MSNRSGLMRFLPLVVIACGFALFFALGLHRYLTLEFLQDSRKLLRGWVERAGIVAPLVYILAYVVVVACSLPGGLVMTLTGGFLFGTIAGGTFAVIGATIGATCLFLAARTALGDFLRTKTGSTLAKLEAGFREDAFSYLLILRLVPLFPFFLVNLAPAFLGVSLGVYVAATMIGVIPATFVFSSVGAGLGAVFDTGGTPDIRVITSWPVLGPLLGLAGLALIPVVYKRFKRTA
jgi:uncharacterized membrane protein YdjX (TVP38/TMEM64 family)